MLAYLLVSQLMLCLVRGSSSYNEAQVYLGVIIFDSVQFLLKTNNQIKICYAKNQMHVSCL